MDTLGQNTDRARHVQYQYERCGYLQLLGVLIQFNFGAHCNVLLIKISLGWEWGGCVGGSGVAERVTSCPSRDCLVSFPDAMAP